MAKWTRIDQGTDREVVRASRGHRTSEVWYDRQDSGNPGYVVTLIEDDDIYDERGVASEAEGQRLGEEWLAQTTPQAQ